MTITTTDRPTITAQMGRKEAQEITDHIRSNFDSLGKMLIEVRERKGFLALGYQSLESYCLTEFGKGKARVYQLIEEARIEEGITAELAASDSPIKSLKMPGTYLRELKVLGTPREQIQAIAYANKLAQNEGKTKATKTHLQAAVNKLNPKKTEQTREIFKTIGFDKGVEVEVLEGRAKGERGVIRKVDKKGAHVELYNGNSMPIAWDISELRIVPETERPKHPTTMDTINIGDKVRIFSSTKNNSKTGEITARINDKIAVVRVEEGGNSEIPYAELEKLETTEETQEQTTDLIWAGTWNPLSSWYYNVKQHEIHSFLLPDLTFQPPAKGSPSDWLEKWRKKNILTIADALLTEDDLAALVIAATSKMNPEDKEAFWAKVNVSKSHSETVELREHLAKIEADRDELLIRVTEAQNRYIKIREKEVNPLEDRVASLDSQLTAYEKELKDKKRELTFELERSNRGTLEQEISKLALANQNLQEQLAEAETTIQSMIAASTPSVLASHASEISSTTDDTAAHSEVSVENTPINSSPGDTAVHTNFLLENTPEISSPGDTAAHTDILLENTPEILERLEIERNKAIDRINNNQAKKINQTNKTNKKEIEKLDRSTANEKAKLEQLEKFSQFRVGQTICHKRHPLILGKIIKLEFSQGGMPLVWVRYFKDGELEQTPNSELVSMIFTVDT